MNPPLITRRRLLPLFVLPVTAVFSSTRNRADASPAPETDEPIALDVRTVKYCPSSEELAFLGLINDYRTANALAPLQVSRTLGAAARHHSLDMAKNNYFSHQLLNGISWSANIKNYGYTVSQTLGENIAAGNATAQETFANWKASPEHNRNMLASAYRAIGIGRAYRSTSTYGYYWTTTFGGTFDTKPSC